MNTCTPRGSNRPGQSRHCPRCGRVRVNCFCARIPLIDNHWPVWIVQDAAEARHALGTGIATALSLAKSTLVTVSPGAPGPAQEDLTPLLAQNPVLVYPGGNTQLSFAQEVRPLVFIDATWRKSRRLLHEHPRLNALDRVSLTAPPPSRYRLRKQPAPGAVSTLEAVVWLLSSLEQAPEKYQPLLDLMDWMIERQIAQMGRSTFDRNYRHGHKDHNERNECD